MSSTTKNVTARQRAREASMRYITLEKKREAAQVRYFEAADGIDRAYAQRDREIAAAEQRAAQAVAAVREEADTAIRELAELNVPRAEIQDRLGCTAADVRRALDASRRTNDNGSNTANDEAATHTDTYGA